MPELRRAGGVRAWRGGEAGQVLLELEHGSASVAVARDGSVRLRATAQRKLPPDPAAAVGRASWRAAPAEPYLRDEGGIALAFEGAEGCVQVELEPQPFALRVLDRAGRLLTRVSDLAFGADDAARLALDAPAGAQYFGFGEKAGPLDKRGTLLQMRNRDADLRHRSDPLYLAVPFVLELRREEPAAPGRSGAALATGVLLDAFAPSRFDVAAQDPEHVRFETLAGGVDLCVFPGPRPADVLRRFTARVGRCPLPPLWALGHHQSRWSYRSERQVRRVAREIRARGIPSDAIHLDIDYMDGYRVFTWHPGRFPDPRKLLRDLAEQGFHVVVFVDPGVKVDPGYAIYRDGRDRDLFCRQQDGAPFSLRVWPGEAALPDFNREPSRAWWGELHRTLLDDGVAGFVNDMNEPAGWRSDLRLGRAILPLRKQDLSRVAQADPADPERRVPHEHVRNLYALQQCRATRSFLERADERRPFLVSRSGFAGIGRHAAVWTGDNASRWDHLRLSLPMLLNLSLSGVPFCGADIGGFAGRPGRELYARWMQLGALYPFCRTHTWWLHPRQEPWRFGRRVEAIARAALELRMRLLPYLYGLFREAEQSGAPVWRPLFYEFPEDPRSSQVEDQVLVGPSLLVAPVLERGARERRVYLPPGTWISWEDDARYVGPRTVRVSAPLEQLPLFVRAGTVLPTRSPVGFVAQEPVEPLVLEVFPGADGTSELVEDDGETTAYRSGALARTRLALRDRAAGRLRLELGAREGAFEVGERRIRVCVRSCPEPRAVWLDGTRLAPGVETPGYAAEAGRVDVRLLDEGEAHSLEIEPAP